MTQQNSKSKKLAAATAAAAALYVGGVPAQADLVENDNGFTLTGSSQTTFLDVDGDGTNEFRMGIADEVSGPFGTFPFTMYWGDASNFASNALINAVGDAPGTFRNAPVGLTVGPTVGAGYTFGVQQVRVITADGAFSYAQGFSSGQNGFIGFSFQGTSGQAHYGWIEVNFVASASQAHSLSVIRWVYDDTPGQSVQVGVIPEPNSFGLAALACGMAGVCRWRRREG